MKPPCSHSSVSKPWGMGHQPRSTPTINKGIVVFLLIHSTPYCFNSNTCTQYISICPILLITMAGINLLYFYIPKSSSVHIQSKVNKSATLEHNTLKSTNHTLEYNVVMVLICLCRYTALSTVSISCVEISMHCYLKLQFSFS